VASKLGSASLLASVRTAFVHGMDLALLVSAGIALTGVVLTLIFLPASNTTQKVQPVMDGDSLPSGQRPTASTMAD
jgi:hypothetical protein